MTKIASLQFRLAFPRWFVVLGMIICLSAFGSARGESLAQWHPANAPLMTRWAQEVSPTNALPEYPRPQLVRADWLNLNGLWDYSITPDTSNAVSSFAGKILVPFPLESALSGVMAHLGEHSKLWYHKDFLVPKSWIGQRVRLHFGAVDWLCHVWMNGHDIGQHQGGYDAFTFDVTDALSPNGPNELLVSVTDPTEGDQPRGKQSMKPEGIFYTACSGIWQTVWLEPVPDSCIDGLKIVSDVDNQFLRLRVSVNSPAENLKVEAVASKDGKEIARISGMPNSELNLKVTNPHLWSPNDPFLYDLKVTLKNGDQLVDSVSSYFGMRKIALGKDEQGFTRITLNNKPFFEIGTLDQGFWPDGIYTAPTDAALRSDIEFLKQAGFNFTRKHVKAEPERWYYWCDRLGLLVWQDMPSGNNATVSGRRDFENELLHLVKNLEDHPSIVVWVLFNEGWGQYDTESLTRWLKELDPTRLVDNASGWTDMRAGDIIDMHSYPGPDVPPSEPHRAAALGEFGGLGLSVDGHLWSSNSWGYVMLHDDKELSDQYSRLLKQVWRSYHLRGLSAAVYTQTADVETECNGLLTYDRARAKINLADLQAANRSGIDEPSKKIILPNGMYDKSLWKYTFEQPAENWFLPGFADSAWKEGAGGFGTEGTPGIFLHTVWNTSDIWLRRNFNLTTEVTPGMKLQVFHDEDVEIYLNGILALKLSGFITDYDDFDISSEALKLLRPGNNTIAVHCHQTTGGQGVDVGIVAPQEISEKNAQ
jgi:Glycosyl hydrolases family 2, sugar binding domain/Glycosyl hydrolases family 2/Glycosyl hydrolases family 2, TIM barrel domain